MATLSLPGLTIGLLVWLFSTSVIPSVSTSALSSPSFESCHDDSKADPSPSSLIYSPSSSTSPCESIKSSNQEATKKKKKMKKKKSAKREADHTAITANAPRIGRTYVPPQKVRFPCMV